ncbi:MAG: hypothetical protein ABI237_14880 [Ginsengibacter sp.]
MHIILGSKHTYKLLTKTALLKPVLHTILYWVTKGYIKKRRLYNKTLNEKPAQFVAQHGKSYRLYLRLRQWQKNNEAESLIQLHYAQKPKNPV